MSVLDLNAPGRMCCSRTACWSATIARCMQARVGNGSTHRDSRRAFDDDLRQEPADGAAGQGHGPRPRFRLAGLGRAAQCRKTKEVRRRPAAADRRHRHATAELASGQLPLCRLEKLCWRGSEFARGTDLSAWLRLWGCSDGDVVQAEPWPTAVFPESAERARGHLPHRRQLCRLRRQHRSRATARLRPRSVCRRCGDNWLPLTFDRYAIVAPAVPEDPGPPEIPVAGDGLFHGATAGPQSKSTWASICRKCRSVVGSPRKSLCA